MDQILFLVVLCTCSVTFGISIENNKPDENPNFTATNPADPPVQEQYRTQYYYAPQQQPHFVHAAVPDWNRDTYANAATDLGYSGDASQAYATSYHVPSTSYGGGDDGYDSDGGLGGGGILGGLGGLAGLLGVKGLKGLGIIGLLKLGLIPLAFLIIPILFLIPLLLLFIPIPVITVPQGRSFGTELKEIGGKMTTLARSVLESEQCIERISCEMSRYGRGTYLDKTLKRMIGKFEKQMPVGLQRMARAYMDSGSAGCKKYNCFLIEDSTNMAKKHKKISS